MSEIIETKAICKQNNRYIGWPTIACAPDGTLHAVFSGDRDGHICPFGKSYLMSSRDVGNTWSEPQVVSNNATPGQVLTAHMHITGTHRHHASGHETD